jgi:hypothetical protein
MGVILGRLWKQMVPTEPPVATCRVYFLVRAINLLVGVFLQLPKIT